MCKAFGISDNCVWKRIGGLWLIYVIKIDWSCIPQVWEVWLVKIETVLLQHGCINIEILWIRIGWGLWIDNLCSLNMECLILYSLGINSVSCLIYEFGL